MWGQWWRLRGSESNQRGKIAEEAAVEQIRRDAASSGKVIYEVDGSNGPGGYDNVRIEFEGEGANMTAVIKIGEVKWHGDRYVPFADFTAIVDNMQKNYEALEERLYGLVKSGELSPDQADALQEAIADKLVSVELFTAGRTKIGSQGANTALQKIQDSLNGFFEKKVPVSIEKIEDAILRQAEGAAAAQAAKGGG